MFEKIRSFAPKHASLLESAYENSSLLSIPVEQIPFREIQKEDMERIYQAIDDVFSLVGEGYGLCFKVHPILKNILDSMGYKSEVVIGAIEVNGEPFIDCDFDYIKEQWESGFQQGELRIHCWLLLENGLYLDVTAYKDVFKTYEGCDLMGTNAIVQCGQLFEYTPIVLGIDFILRTSIPPELAKEETNKVLKTG